MRMTCIRTRKGTPSSLWSCATDSARCRPSAGAPEQSGALTPRAHSLEVADHPQPFDDFGFDAGRCGGNFLDRIVEAEESTLTKLESPVDFFVAIGQADLRQRITERWLARGHHLETAIHPTAVVSPSAKLGPGTCVMAGAIIQTESRIGRGVIINTGSTVDHDALLGDYVHVAPGAHLAGNVEVGESTWIGLGSSVRENLVIGSRTLVGAGSVMVRDLPDDVVAYGSPCRVMRSVKVSPPVAAGSAPNSP